MEQTHGKYLAILISEVRSSARELYPLTKNYHMGLLPIGTKKLILYQLESLLPLHHLAKVVVIVAEEDKSLRPYLQSQFLPQHRDYPHQIDFFAVKDISNTFAAVKELLAATKKEYEGFLILHGDTIIGVPLTDLFSLHETSNSDLTLLLKAKRELGEQEKKLPEGEIETEVDNVLLGDKGEVLFIDMADELENNGVSLTPSIYSQVKKAVFRRTLDSKVYLMSSRVGRIILELSSEEIYEMKPWLIQLLVQHQTNKQLLALAGQHDQQLRPLKVYAHFCEQDAFIRKISTKKMYEILNFDSLIRGPKQKQTLLPNDYSDKMEYRAGAGYLIAENAVLGNGGKIRRSVIGAGCRIGKNVELFNSILLEKVELKDNCKINDCVLGVGTSVGENAQVKSTYSESGCRVADAAKVEGETLIRSE